MTEQAAPGKGVQREARFLRKYPLTVLHAALARPFSRALAALGLSPNQVSCLSLFVSLGGLWQVAQGTPALAASGAAFVYFGNILDHADGQVARRTHRESVWGMFLDSIIDRIVETGMFLAILVAGVRGVAAWDTPGWTLLPLADAHLVLLAAGGLALIAFSKYVLTYSYLLFLRSYHLAGGTALGPGQAEPPRHRWVELLPGYNRDVLITAWCLGLAVHQVPLMLLGLGAVNLALGVAAIGRFFVARNALAAYAPRVLHRDFH